MFGFGGGGKSDASTASTSSTSTAAPRGVPVISKWKQARDGSITGVISGSSAFSDGDPVTTSPIKGKAVGGTVVSTKSGSRCVANAIMDCCFASGTNDGLKVS